jgi:exopolysaccharide biosynthesis predicted pyruvyltransferase EpsI
VTRDISLPNYASFDEFVEAISQASLIITTRLHVGILGAMGGRNVVLFEGGYWKARGIHEYSMTDLPNIQFRDLDEMDRNISS